MPNGNPFFIDPTLGRRPGGLHGLGQALGDIRKQREAQAAQQAASAEIEAAMDSGDQKQIQKVMVKYPQASAAMERAFGYANERTKGMTRELSAELLTETDPVRAADAIDRYLPRISDAGGMPMHLANAAQELREGTQTLEQVQGRAMMLDPDLVGDRAGKPAALAEWEEMTAGMTEADKAQAKRVKLGLAPRAVGSAIQTITEAGTGEQVGDTEAIISERKKFGEMIGAQRSKAIDDGYERIQKIDLSMSNMDKAIELLDQGAGTGAIERFAPSIKAASVELDNIRNRMALDVIGSVTFGALSESELEMAKMTALPDGLDGPELAKHLRDRKAAQQKLRDYFSDQIDHVDQGGTVASFLRMKRREAEAQPAEAGAEAAAAPTADQQAIDWARANPNDPRAQQILQMQGAQ